MSQVASHHQRYQLTRTDVEHMAVVVVTSTWTGFSHLHSHWWVHYSPASDSLSPIPPQTMDHCLTTHIQIFPQTVFSATRTSPISLTTDPLPLLLMLASNTVRDNTSDTAKSRTLHSLFFTVHLMQSPASNTSRSLYRYSHTLFSVPYYTTEPVLQTSSHTAPTVMSDAFMRRPSLFAQHFVEWS